MSSYHAKAGSSLHKASGTSVHVKKGSSIHAATQEQVYAKPGSTLHTAGATGTYAKKGTSLHIASGSAPKEKHISGTPGVTRYYGKQDEILHRKDPLYNAHKIPEKTEKEATDVVHKIASAAAEKVGRYGDEDFQSLKQSIIASAVDAAASKVAEIKHKANVKAMQEVRDAKARARATVEVSKKEEEKQEAATKAQAQAAEAQQAVEAEKEKEADTEANGRDVSNEK